MRRGRGRAGRGEHRAVRSEQSDGWESDPGRQPLRSKYQHRRTKWRPWPRHMTRAPPLRAIPLRAGRGRHGPGTPPSGPLTAHALCCRLAGLDPCAPPHLGLLRCAVGRRRPLEPRGVGPFRSPGRGGAVARHISIWGGARGAPPLLRLRGTIRCSLRASLFFAFSVCRLAEGFSRPSPQGPRTTVYPERPHTSWGDLRVQAGGAEILCPRLPPTPTPLKLSPDSSRPTRPRPSNC